MQNRLPLPTASPFREVGVCSWHRSALCTCVASTVRSLFLLLRTLGHQGYCDLPVCGVLFQIESTYGFTPLAINVGTAYFRRLAASNQAMLKVSISHPSFIGLVRGLTFEEPGKPLVGAIHAPHLSNEVWLTLIHLTCTYIAAKNVAPISSRCTLRGIISHIYGVESRAVDPELSSDLEIQCLEALDWELGPSVVQQEDISYAADTELPVSPVTCNQEQPGMYDSASSSANEYALTECICKVAPSSWPVIKTAVILNNNHGETPSILSMSCIVQATKRLWTPL